MLAAALAAAFLAAIIFASKASAHPLGGGGQVDERLWDTDNLKIGTTYTARSFAIPHYSDSPHSNDRTIPGIMVFGAVSLSIGNLSPCQQGVMDGFFQNRASQPRNDLPVLEKTAGGWEETTGHSCIVFRNAQGTAVSIAGGNGGYWLDNGQRHRNATILHPGGTGHLHERHRAVPCRRRRHHDLRRSASYPSARRTRPSDLGGLHSLKCFQSICRASPRIAGFRAVWLVCAVSHLVSFL